MLSKISPNKAFSLIELSLTILIVGILIIGITQGSKLLYIAKISSAKNLTKSSPVPAIRGLKMWFNAADYNNDGNITGSQNGNNIEHGEMIASWKDSSPSNTEHKSFIFGLNPSGGIPQTYNKNGINGLPTIQFNDNGGGGQRPKIISALNDFLSPDSGTIIAVTAGASFDTNDAQGLYSMEYSNYSGFVEMQCDSSLCYSQIGTTYQTLNNPVINPWKDKTISVLTRKNGKIILRINGIETDFGNGSAGSAMNTTDNITVWLGRNAGGGQFIGQMGEIIFYNRALHPSEIIGIEKYLKHKWGILY